MNPFLASLMGQQSSGIVATPEQLAETERLRRMFPNAPEFAPEDEILVEANRSAPRTGATVDGMSAPNDRAIEAVQADVSRGQEASQRRGLFGVKGTLRDVLGVLGDAFLIQGGRAPMYGPLRRKELMSDAWAGATEDPLAAAERVGFYDYEEGQKLLEAAKKAELGQAQLESLDASRDALAEEKSFRKYTKAREMLGGLFNTPGAVVNGQINPRALAVAERIAASAGMSLEDFMINEGMSEQEVREYAMSVLDPYKQERLEDYDVGLQQGQQNADSRSMSARASMIRANRPPAGRNPPQPTRASMLEEFLKIPQSQRTPEQQSFIERETTPTRSQRQNRGTSSSGNTGWTIRPRSQ